MTAHFAKGDFLLEYRGKLKDADDTLADSDAYVYEFFFKGKKLW